MSDKELQNEKNGVSDVFGYGKIVERILGFLDKAGFAYFKKTLDRRDIETDVTRKIEHAKADVEVMRIKAAGMREIFQENFILEIKDGEIVANTVSPLNSDLLANRTAYRLQAQEERRQLNVENIVGQAAQNLIDEELPAEEVSSDWSARFIRESEDISDENMQALWAKILAGEIKRPGSYSVRTLNVLKNLAVGEAEIFTKYADRIVTQGPQVFIAILNGSYDIPLEEIIILRDCGLIAADDQIIIQFRVKPNQTLINFAIRDHWLTISSTSRSVDFDLNVNVLTTAAKELSNLLKPQPNLDFLSALMNLFSIKGWYVEAFVIVERNIWNEVIRIEPI